MPDRIEVQGVGKPGRDFILVPTADEARLAALLEERRGYAIAREVGEKQRYGMDVDDTLAAIDTQIENLGGTVPDAGPRPTTQRGRRPVSGW